MSEQRESEPFVAVLTITVREAPPQGLIASLISDGDMSTPWIDNRFYSIAEMPPPTLAPNEFWGALLARISSFLIDTD